MKITLAIACLALGACAIASTSQQDLAYARWATCHAPYAQLERVDLDGRITFLASNSATRQSVLDCLAGAAQSGPPLPEPIAIRPSGGP